MHGSPWMIVVSEGEDSRKLFNKLIEIICVGACGEC